MSNDSHDLNHWQCPHCHRPNSNDTNTCKSCGTTIPTSLESETPSSKGTQSWFGFNTENSVEMKVDLDGTPGHSLRISKDPSHR